MTRFLIALGAVALGACAAGNTTTAAGAAPAPAPAGRASAAATPPSKPAAMNPAGSFEFSTEVNGSPMKGNVTISGAPGSWTGSMTSDITPELPLTSVVVDGQTMKLVLDTPNGAATISMLFKGEAFTGNWELGGASGPLTGKRVK